MEISENDLLIQQFTKMSPGQKLIYHIGITGWLEEPANIRLVHWFHNAQDSGDYEFLQRKIGKENPASDVSVYEYIIVRRVITRLIPKKSTSKYRNQPRY